MIDESPAENTSLGGAYVLSLSLSLSLSPPPSLHSFFLLPPFLGSNKEALAVAQTSGADFIRAEGYVFSHVADEGWMDSCAGELLRYRKFINAENVLVLTDIKKKHS